MSAAHAPKTSDAMSPDDLGRGITLGAGLTKTQGVWHPLDTAETAVRGIYNILEFAPSAFEAWWSPHRWEGNSRASESAWISSCALVLDLDARKVTEAKNIKSAPTSAMLYDVPQLMAMSAYHTTPHGFRFIIVIDQPITDAAQWKRLACAFVELAKAAIKREGFNVPDADGVFLEVDAAASTDVHRIFFRQRSVVNGESRNASLNIIRSAPFTLEELMHFAEASERAVPLAEDKSNRMDRVETRACDEIEEAVARYRAEHREPWPKHPGTCPACGHNDCFHQMPDSTDRWFCFSTRHPDACGVRSGTGAHGDVIDLNLWRDRKIGGSDARVQHLRDKGYLSATREKLRRPMSEAPRVSGANADFAQIAAELAQADACELEQELRANLRALPDQDVTWMWLGALAKRRGALAKLEPHLPSDDARRALLAGSQSTRRIQPRPPISEAIIKQLDRLLRDLVAVPETKKATSPPNPMGDLHIESLERVVHRRDDHGTFDLALRVGTETRTATGLRARELRSYPAMINLFCEYGLQLPEPERAGEIWKKRMDQLLSTCRVRMVAAPLTRAGHKRMLIRDAIKNHEPAVDLAGLEQNAAVVRNDAFGQAVAYVVLPELLVSRVQDMAEREKFTRAEILDAARSLGARTEQVVVPGSNRKLDVLEFDAEALTF